LRIAPEMASPSLCPEETALLTDSKNEYFHGSAIITLRRSGLPLMRDSTCLASSRVLVTTASAASSSGFTLDGSASGHLAVLTRPSLPMALQISSATCGAKGANMSVCTSMNSLIRSRLGVPLLLRYHLNLF